MPNETNLIFLLSAAGCSEEDAPSVPNSSVQRFSGGTVRWHRCNAGFERQGAGSMVIYCDGTRWRNQPPQCVRSSLCGPAPHVENSLHTEGPDGVITYTCESDYKRRLGEGSIRCGANGQWIGSTGVCIRKKEQKIGKSCVISIDTIHGKLNQNRILF